MTAEVYGRAIARLWTGEGRPADWRDLDRARMLASLLGGGGA
jgi:hypothetical protein